MWLTGGSIAVSQKTGAVSPDYRVFDLDPSIEPRFLHHLLRSQPYRDQYNLFVRANTTFDRRIQQEDLDQLPLWLPDSQEQRRIADFLDDRVARIDRVIAARQRQLELSSAHRSAELVACMFRPGDEMVPCRTMAEVRLGRQRSPEQEKGDHMIPYLRSANVRDGEFDLEDVKTMNYTPAEQAVFQLRRGDVLVTEGSASAEAVGASAAWMEELPGTVCFQNTLIRLRSGPSCLPEFMEVWARASHAAGAAKAWSSGASILHLGSEGMGRLLMPRLQEPQQRARVRAARALLDEHAGLQVALDRSVAALTEYKQSLITAAVTGELDVTAAGSGIPG